MKIIFKLAVLAVFLAFGVWLWLFLFPGPEEVIRHRLAKLAQAVSFSPRDGNLARIASAESVGGFFSTNVEINIDVPGYRQHTFMGRAEIIRVILVLRSKMSGLAMKFPDVDVTVAPDRQSATADLTLEVTLTGDRDVIVQEMKVVLQKIDGQWLIRHVETVRTLS